MDPDIQRIEQANLDNKPDSTPPPSPSPSGGSNKKLIFIIIGLVVIVGVVLAIVLTHKSTPKPVATTTSDNTETPDPGYDQTESQLDSYKQEATIQLTASGPSPQTLNVPLNTRVIFQNLDSAAHTISITPGEPVPYQFYNNRTVDVGGGYPWVATKPVTFHYYYSDDPAKSGEVVVK